MTIAIPDVTAAHIIGQGGKGLKQLHNISGAWVSAYMLMSGLRDECHVSIIRKNTLSLECPRKYPKGCPNTT